MTALDAIVVGSGPNGLAAAIELARRGSAVRIYEAADTVGGGLRSAELTLPGFVHDVCSTAHPFGLASPFFRSIDLERHGLEWVQPELAFAHALEPSRAVPFQASFDQLEETLGADGRAWRRLFEPLVREQERLLPMLLRPVVRPPRHPILLARFGVPALLSVNAHARLAFRGREARALFGGVAAHAIVPFDAVLSSSFAIVLVTLAHAVGWPFARGGSQRIADALAAEARSITAEVVTSERISSLRDLPPARVVLLDVTPRQLLAIAGDRIPAGYAGRLNRFRYGPGILKVDWALDGPIPWRDPLLAKAGTVHLGGTIRDIAAAEDEVFRGRHPDRPYVLLAQPTVADPSRAPAGKHIGWAYTHVPNGSPLDVSDRIEAQVERYAPGFRDLIIGRHVMTAPEVEAHDVNFVGGDINGGLQSWKQLIFRPIPRWDPYAVPGDVGLFLTGASTPPGGGIHGMGGWHAARSAAGRLGK